MPAPGELRVGETHRFRSTRYAFDLPAGMDREMVITAEVLDGVQIGLLLPQLEDGSFPDVPVNVRRKCCGG